MNTLPNSSRIYPLFKKNRFYNHQHDKPESFLLHTVPSFLGAFWARARERTRDEQEWVIQQEPVAMSSSPLITWLGHSSFLIQIGGINILTDPVFDDISFLFPRLLPLGILPAHMPKIDIILLSHNHPDHCSVTTLQQLNHPELTLLVPQGDKAWLQAYNFPFIYEFTWWENFTLQLKSGQAPVTFSFLPAYHWSQHGLFDCNKSLWGSWMVQYSDFLIYFAGDTAYGSHFSHIAAEFKRIAVALMPIAPCEPSPWMRRTHMDGQQAVDAFIDLQATQFIPMHWGTFPFGTDTFHGPLNRLQKAWESRKYLLGSQALMIPKVGQRLEF